MTKGPMHRLVFGNSYRNWLYLGPVPVHGKGNYISYVIVSGHKSDFQAGGRE
jgi:hypothetical protein